MLRISPLAILCALSIVGCQEATTGPAEPDVAPRFNFLNGPTAPGPNVLRYADNTVGFFIDDFETGLIAVQGLTPDPRDHGACGGTELGATLAVQEVGLLRDLIHRHVRGDDVAIHVFSLSGFEGDLLGLICNETPIAVGAGRLVVTENAHSAGYHMQGTLTELATGDPVRLTAFARQMVLPDGTLRIMTTFVRLRPLRPR